MIVERAHTVIQQPPSKPATALAMQPGEFTAQQIAEAVRDAMSARDQVFHAMQMQVTHVAPGAATLKMSVRSDMLNGHATCHGGMITTLADTAFAYACNSRNAMTVASAISVDLLLPAFEGDILSASCREQHCGGRMGVYDCDIHNQHGQRIAIFRGHSYSLKGRAAVEGLPLPSVAARGVER